MASNYIQPTTETLLAGELSSLVRQMWTVKASADKLMSIFNQIAMDGRFDALATALGYADPADAEAVYNLLAATFTETVKGSFNQMVSRVRG